MEKIKFSKTNKTEKYIDFLNDNLSDDEGNFSYKFEFIGEKSIIFFAKKTKNYVENVNYLYHLFCLIMLRVDNKNQDIINLIYELYYKILKKDKEGELIINSTSILIRSNMKFDLKLFYRSLMKKTIKSEYIFEAGINVFKDKVNLKILVNILIKNDKNGISILDAGTQWKLKNKKTIRLLFNYLLEVDETGEKIINAIEHWPSRDDFDYDLIVKKILNKKTTPYCLYRVGKNLYKKIKTIDVDLLFKELFNKLYNKIGHDMNYLYYLILAGNNWPEEKFDYEKVVNFIVNYKRENILSFFKKYANFNRWGKICEKYRITLKNKSIEKNDMF